MLVGSKFLKMLAVSIGNSMNDSGTNALSCAEAVPPCVHFVGFRDDRYSAAVRVWGRPDFVHRWWGKRARREIAEGDTVVFATGEWTQEPSRYNAPDITEDDL
jgi:hypothetical protein